MILFFRQKKRFSCRFSVSNLCTFTFIPHTATALYTRFLCLFVLSLNELGGFPGSLQCIFGLKLNLTSRNGLGSTVSDFRGRRTRFSRLKIAQKDRKSEHNTLDKLLKAFYGHTYKDIFPIKVYSSNKAWAARLFPDQFKMKTAENRKGNTCWWSIIEPRHEKLSV